MQPGGLRCTCGLEGCLEAYASAGALLRYAGEGYKTAEEVVRAGNQGDPTAREALRTYAGWLASGISAIVHTLDPEAMILAGGIAQNW